MFGYGLWMRDWFRLRGEAWRVALWHYGREIQEDQSKRWRDAKKDGFPLKKIGIVSVKIKIAMREEK